MAFSAQAHEGSAGGVREPACSGHHVVDGGPLFPAHELQQKVLLRACSRGSLMLRWDGKPVIRCSLMVSLLSRIKAECRQTSGGDPEPDELASLICAPVWLLSRDEPLLDQTTAIVVPWSPVSGRRRREIVGVDAISVVRPIRSETRARLVEAIAKARKWLDELLSGQVRDTHEIAAREACSERSIRTTLNLAFLSPALVQAAVEGRLPHGAGLSSLTDAPLNWKEQQRSWIGTSFKE